MKQIPLRHILIGGFIGSLFIASFAFAHEETDAYLCPAVYVCDDEGNVLPEYLNGPCADHFRAQCLSNKLQQCHEEDVAKIKKKNKKLRRKIRALLTR